MHTNALSLRTLNNWTIMQKNGSFLDNIATISQIKDDLYGVGVYKTINGFVMTLNFTSEYFFAYTASKGECQFWCDVRGIKVVDEKTLLETWEKAREKGLIKSIFQVAQKKFNEVIP